MTIFKLDSSALPADKTQEVDIDLAACESLEDLIKQFAKSFNIDPNGTIKISLQDDDVADVVRLVKDDSQTTFYEVENFEEFKETYKNLARPMEVIGEILEVTKDAATAPVKDIETAEEKEANAKKFQDFKKLVSSPAERDYSHLRRLSLDLLKSTRSKDLLDIMGCYPQIRVDKIFHHEDLYNEELLGIDVTERLQALNTKAKILYEARTYDECINIALSCEPFMQQCNDCNDVTLENGKKTKSRIPEKDFCLDALIFALYLHSETRARVPKTLPYFNDGDKTARDWFCDYYRNIRNPAEHHLFERYALNMRRLADNQLIAAASVELVDADIKVDDGKASFIIPIIIFNYTY